jgi:hypothetical protein
MDQDETISGTPTAGSPEVQNLVADPVGGISNGAGQHRVTDLPFDLIAGEADHGRFNESSGQFE